jgi:hypothetical protein
VTFYHGIGKNFVLIARPLDDRFGDETTQATTQRGPWDKTHAK